MSFWQKAWIKIFTLLKAVLALAVFICLEYAVFSVFAYFGIDRQIYRGTYNFATCVLVFVVMFVTNLLYSKKKEPLFMMGRLKPDQVAALIVVGLGMLGFVTTYLGIVNRIADYLKPVSQAVEDYRDSVYRFSEVPQRVIPLWDSFLYIFTLCFIVPVTEEMTFRGVFYGALRKGFGPWVSVILCALGFGIMHGLSVHIGYAIVCGLIIASCYYLTESLIAPIILHIVFNIFGSGLPTLLSLDCFNIPKTNVNALLIGVNTVSIIFMPLAVIAIAYLVNAKRKKAKEAKASAEIISVTVQTQEEPSEDSDIIDEEKSVESVNVMTEGGSGADS